MAIENPPAFPRTLDSDEVEFMSAQPGMSLRDHFAGQALANQAICTGTAPEWQLATWFGNRCGICREEIAAKQAGAYADAMLLERAKATGAAA